MRERDATQDIDQVPFMRPITKWATAIPNVRQGAGVRAQGVSRRADRAAGADAHRRLQRDPAGAGRARADRAGARTATTVLPACNGAQLDEVVELLARAERPVFVVGRGVMQRRRDAMRWRSSRNARASRWPRCSTRPTLSPRRTRSRWGRSAATAFGSANRTVPQADLIVAIGAHIDVFSTTFKYGIFSEQAKLVHHSAAPGQIGIVFPVTLGVTGSTMSFIAGLTERAAKAGLKQVVGRRARRRAPTGRPSCRARCGTKPSRSSRSSSRT